MIGEVVALPRRQPSENSLRSRLGSLIAIMHAIEAGELLAALPECEIARSQHKIALALLELLDRELSDLYEASAS